jgi:hypothetical protein
MSDEKECLTYHENVGGRRFIPLPQVINVNRQEIIENIVKSGTKEFCIYDSNGYHTEMGLVSN